MKENRFFIFILVILLAFGLAACTKSASQPSTSDEDTNLPLPTMGTQEPMNMLEEMATQTAMAQEAGAQDAAAETGEGEVVAKDVEDAGGETAADAQDSTEGGGEQAAAADTPAETDEEAGGGQETVIDPDDYDVPDSYTLKSGEFPYCIARRFNISPADLLSANGLNLNSQVYPGTNLTIPKNAGTFDQGSRALKAHPTNYTVVSGDTVNSIACLFGDVDPRAIVDANELSSGTAISAGKVIKIP